MQNINQDFPFYSKTIIKTFKNLKVLLYKLANLRHAKPPTLHVMLPLS